MIYLRRSIVLIFLGFGLASAQNSRAVEEEFRVLRQMSEIGDYKGGLFRSTKALSFAGRHCPKESAEQLLAKCYNAYFLIKAGKREQGSQAVQMVRSQALWLQDSCVPKLLPVLEVLATIYIEEGNYRQLSELTERAREANRYLNEEEKIRLFFYQQLVRLNQGYLNQVISESAPCVSSFLNQKATRTKRSSSKDSTSLLLGQARVVGIYAEALFKNGYADSAKAVLNAAEVIATEQKSTNEWLMLLTSLRLQKGKVACQLGQLLKSEKELKATLVYAKSYYLDHSEVVQQIQTELIRVLLLQGKKEEADFYNNDLASKVVGYYGRNSLTYHLGNYNDVEDAMAGYRWAEAESRVLEFLRHPNLPEFHASRAKALQDLYQIQLRLHKGSKTDTVLILWANQEKALLGSNAPAIFPVYIKQAMWNYTFTAGFTQTEKQLAEYSPGNFATNISVAHPDYVEAVSVHARYWFQQSDYTKAEKIIVAAMEAAKIAFGNTSLAYAVFLNKKAQWQIEKGLYTEVTPVLDQAISVYADVNRQAYIPCWLEALELKLCAQIALGEYSQAQSTVKELSKLLGRYSGVSVEEYVSSVELGLLYANTGRFNKAERFIGNLLNMAEKDYGIDHKLTYKLLNSLAELHILSGNFTEADKLSERSLRITSTHYGKNSLPYAQSLMVQKHMYSALGDAENATLNNREAVMIYKTYYGETNILTSLITSEYALAALEYQMQKNTEKLYKELDATIVTSLENTRSGAGAQSVSYATVLERAGLYFAIKRDSSKAIQYVLQAKTIWDSRLGAQNIHSSRLDKLLGEIFYSHGRHSEALICFERARSSYLKLFDENHPDYVETYGKCAQLYFILGDKAKAKEASEFCISRSLEYIRNVFPILSEKGKIAYWEKIKEDYEFYKTLTFANAQPDPDMLIRVMDIQLQTKSVLLNSTLKVKQRILGSQDTILIRMYQNLLQQRDILAQAYSMTPAEKHEAGIDIRELELSIERLEKELSQRSHLFAAEKKTGREVNFKALRSKLTPGEIVLEVVPFRYFLNRFTDTVWYAVLAVDPKGEKPEFVLLKNGKELQGKYLKYYRNCIRFNSADEFSYVNYWKPLEPLIKPTTKIMYLVTDGVYNQLNPETFRKPDGAFVLNSLPIYFLSSSRDIIERRSIDSKTTVDVSQVVLLGNPSFYPDTVGHRNVSSLPGSELEVKKIDSLLVTYQWKSNVLVQKGVTENYTRNVQNPSVLHISTHGFFAEPVKSSTHDFQHGAADNPLLRSGLLLSNGGHIIDTRQLHAINREDGVLTAFEAMSLSLDKTNLVILSACETGLGEVKIGEGVMGLQRAFQVAGAKTVVMSLFKVSDEVTQKLMLEFYINWIKMGNKHTAFAEAKKSIMVNYKEPKLWGAFIMIGME